MITGYQIRAARAMLRWSAQETGQRAGLTKKTLERMEQHAGIPPSRSRTIVALKSLFEDAGIEFIGTPESGPGIRLWTNETPDIDR